MLCTKCNEAMGGSNRTCPSCGTWNSSQVEQNREQATVDYSAKIKRLALSVPFILGCVLITAGAIGGIFVEFTWLNLLNLTFAAVHIVGLWLIVFDSSKTLAALTMFRISAILTMILICILFGILVFVTLSVTLRGFAFLFVLAIIGGTGYLLIRYYFLALLKVTTPPIPI